MGRWVAVVMARRVRTLPIASAERVRVTISDRDWQSIESAYGQKLSPQARRDIHEKTQEFVDRAEFEQNAEPVSDVHNRINTIIRAAGSFRSALHDGDHDADVYARRLLRKQLRKKGDAIKKRRRKKGDAIKKRRRKRVDPLCKISSDVTRLIFTFQDAQKELNDTKDEGFKKGDAWKRWIRRLTSIAKAHNLPRGARKDSDKQSGSHASHVSPFVEFVWGLQQFVPGTHRRAHSKDALAKAITEARMAKRDE
jgi:hypothetical protein